MILHAIKISLLILAVAPISAFAQGEWHPGVRAVGVPGLLSISTSTWTAVPATEDTMASRSQIVLSNPSTNNASFFIHFSTSTNAPTVAITVASEELEVGETTIAYVTDVVYVWVVSKHTSAESILYQEIEAGF